MGQSVVTGATATCSFGTAPAPLAFLPLPRVMIEGRPAGTIADTVPGVNIPPFAMCTSLSNPQVAAATAAALGVLTPMPCVPLVAAPWIPAAPRTQIGGKPALVSGSTCTCTWGGMISLTNPGTTKTQAS